METNNLTKKERKLLKRQEKQTEASKIERSKKFGRITKNLLIVAVIGWILSLMFQSVEPLPGEKLSDLGREHVVDLTDITYNSTPPTSGSHFAVWARPGTYDRVLSDGYLIHSLEHGYINIAYNCAVGESGDDAIASPSGEFALKRLTYTPEGSMAAFSPETQPPAEVILPKVFASDECKELVKKIEESAKGFERVVISPRTDIKSQIALTAWTYIQNLDTFDEEKIIEFAKAHHNHGPEKTME